MSDPYDNPYDPAQPPPPPTASAPPDPADAPPPPPPPPPPIARSYTDLRHAGFHCPGCGYDLTGATIGGACPECGQHVNPGMMANAPTNGMAITSMVMGILGLASCVMYGIPTLLFGPLGIIFGHVANSQLRSGRYSPGSAAFAKAGLICSYIGTGLVGAAWLAFVLFIILL